MTEEITQELLKCGQRFFENQKTTWSTEELAEIYRVYNLITGHSKKDVNCSSCRRATILEVRNAYLNAKKTQP